MDLLSRGTRLEEWSRHLEQCVGCLACEAHCPAGVPYASMLDQARRRIRERKPDSGFGHWLERKFLDFLLQPRDVREKGFSRLRWAQRLGLLGLLRILHLERLPSFSLFRGLSFLPQLRSPRARPAEDPQARFLHFPGCIDGLFFPAEEEACLRLLSASGGYRELPDSVCCGAVHRHRGEMSVSRKLAKQNILAFEKEEGPVVSRSSACVAALKDYANWLSGDPAWEDRARAFSERVRDWSEILDPDSFGGEGRPGQSIRAVYDDPCHAIHVQGISEGPRKLLRCLPDLHLVEMAHPERCCGAGGTWFLDQPELSQEMIGWKMKEFEKSGARILITSNPGCRIQWEAVFARRKSPAQVLHPVELLAENLKEKL